MNIVHITNLSNNKASGISSIVPSHIRSQSKYANIYWYNINSKYMPPNDLRKLYLHQDSYRKYTKQLLPEPCNNPDLVIFHGVYFYRYCQIANQLNKCNISYIVVPHGSLTKSAVKQKAIKKYIGFQLLFKKFLRNAKAIQYLSEGEYKESGDKWNNNHIIVPNGCNIPLEPKKKFNNLNPVGVFIGRKSIYYKGLDLLLNACNNIKYYLEKGNLKIKIYGPDENKSNEILNERIKRYGLDKYVYILDSIFDEEKINVLMNSDFFILTSRTEGHPVALLEALSYGIPCLVTTGTNMTEEINEFNAGWTADSNVSSIEKTLVDLINDSDQFHIKGSNARELSLKYEWSNIAKETIDMYKKVFDL